MERREVARYDAICGIDVGKFSHFAVVLDQDCEAERPRMRCEVAQNEADIRAFLHRCAGIGRTLVVVDQYGAFGSLIVATCRAEGVDVAHISPERFSKVAATWGEDKTDARDAMIIAEAARSQPRTVMPVPDRADAVASVRVLSSERADAVDELTKVYNRIHATITAACPPLEDLFSRDRLHNKCELEILAEYGGPEGLREAGKAEVTRHMGGIPYMRTRGPRKAEEVFEAIGRQTVSVPGALEMESRVRRLAKRAQELQALVTELEARIDDMSSLIPEVRILTGVPGIGRVHAATIVCEIGDISRFKDANHLASYSGVAPVKHESGSSVKKRKKRKGGNRKLKNALISSARIAARIDPRAKDYYARKLAQHKDGDGKPEPGAVRKALRALARRRVSVIYALLRDGSLYEPSHQKLSA